PASTSSPYWPTSTPAASPADGATCGWPDPGFPARPSLPWGADSMRRPEEGDESFDVGHGIPTERRGMTDPRQQPELSMGETRQPSAVAPRHHPICRPLDDQGRSAVRPVLDLVANVEGVTAAARQRVQEREQAGGGLRR